VVGGVVISSMVAKTGRSSGRRVPARGNVRSGPSRTLPHCASGRLLSVQDPPTSRAPAVRDPPPCGPLLVMPQVWYSPALTLSNVPLGGAPGRRSRTPSAPRSRSVGALSLAACARRDRTASAPLPNENWSRDQGVKGQGLVLTRRRPRPSSRSSGRRLYRDDTRALLGLLHQHPPRMTR
jgi:hypothetical protein